MSDGAFFLTDSWGQGVEDKTVMLRRPTREKKIVVAVSSLVL
jgi:hypothetical protein